MKAINKLKDYLSPVTGIKNGEIWLYKCQCGKEFEALNYNVKYGKTKSCGCLHKKILSERATHGMATTTEYRSWRAMHTRCENKNVRSYKDYGGRGIKVCKRWRTFENFFKDMGPKPSPKHSLDRINNDADYSPKNCKWASLDEQANNKRRTRKVRYKNKYYTISELSEILNLPRTTICNRIYRKWPDKKIVSTKLKAWTKTSSVQSQNINK